MALNHYLFQELGFRGNSEQYYDARNSYLNEVIDRRTGIPITLSLVYIEVGRRAGLEVEGVGLPGHFVVRVQTPARGLLVDPFHGGTLLSEKDCQQRLDRIFGGKVKLEPKMLRPCGRKDMVERVLRNLKAIHLRDEDKLRALRVVDLLVALQPGAPRTCATAGALCRTRLLRPRGARSRVLPGARPPGEGRRGARGARGAAQAQGLTAQLTEGRQFMTTVSTASGIDKIAEYLGGDARGLLDHACKGIPKSSLHLPGPRWVDVAHAGSDRPTPVLRSLQALSTTAPRGDRLRLDPAGRPGHRALGGRVVREEPAYFDPENIVKLAIEGGCNAVASTLGVLGAVARQYAHRIPFLVKSNHNEFLTYPNKFDQIFFASVKQARDMGAVAVGATIYFGSPESARQIVEVSQAFQIAHEMGLATVLWCYLRNPAFKKDKDYHVSADLTGRPITWASRSRPTSSSRSCRRTTAATTRSAARRTRTARRTSASTPSLRPTTRSTSRRYQVANCYMGRAGLINSGGASGENDFAEAVKTAVINKRAGGMGLISGRKAFQRPMARAPAAADDPGRLPLQRGDGRLAPP
jgi:class I fructose-bisphosphate aldolase